MKRIFVITNIEERGNHRKRTTAWFSTLKVATDAVMENDGDMSEGQTNHWAVIEETKEGCEVVAEYWFEWCGGEEGGYQPCSKPAFSHNLLNWGIG